MDIEEYILSVLSFYEPMSMEKIILDFDTDKLKAFDDFSKDELDRILIVLAKNKLIRKTVLNKEAFWIRVYPKRKNIFMRLIKKLKRK